MTKLVNIPLESYRLAQYVVQCPCYVCGEGNTFDAEQCRHCSAPMALVHQANSQDVHPRMLAAVGAQGVGKTVFLGMLLDMLSRHSHDMHALVRGAFSLNLQQTTVAALARCEFPPQTSSDPNRWNWVHAQVQSPRERKPIELVMPDVAGEALAHELDHPTSYLAIHSLLSKSSGALVLIDAVKLQRGLPEQDYFTTKLLSYLHELDSDLGPWSRRPLALVFTKADECERCFEDPAGFARRHAPRLWEQCRTRFPRYSFFASGVAGTCAYRYSPGYGHRHVPLRIEPRGIVEPFAWLLEQARN